MYQGQAGLAHFYQGEKGSNLILEFFKGYTLANVPKLGYKFYLLEKVARPP